MNSHHSEVRHMIDALVPKVQSYSIREIWAWLYLVYETRGMRPDRAEVQRLVSAIIPKVHACSEDFSGP